MKTKRIPFDINKAKAGAKIVTRNGSSVRITCTDVDAKVEGFTLLVLARKDGKELPYLCRENGKASLDESKESESDLFIEEEINFRRMTEQEFAWWLRECPEEHREYKYTDGKIVQCKYIYHEEDANEPIKNMLIRKNGGEWQEPLVEI